MFIVYEWRGKFSYKIGKFKDFDEMSEFLEEHIATDAQNLVDNARIYFATKNSNNRIYFNEAMELASLKYSWEEE